jgi:tetratricopeptide (TPR) repeat protein
MPVRGSYTLLIGVAIVCCGRAAAQDTVEVATGSGRTRLTGQVVDYTGRQLILEGAGARRQEIPADRVLRVETPYGPRQLEADRRLEKKEFAEALALYRRALDEEQRRWVRRLILARMVWCSLALGQPEAAGEIFLLLIQSDPSTPYFDCIPLAWVPAQPSPRLEQAALAWMAQSEQEMPAAVLMGASHLLPTSQRSAALARLQRLSTNADRRIAQLAYAQTWRAAVNVDDTQLDAWDRSIRQMPEPLRAGPYYALGRSAAQRQQWERAATALMRIPILFPQHRALAAAALLDAGYALERLKQPAEAARLYRELVAAYPECRAAAEAKGRLEEAAKPP